MCLHVLVSVCVSFCVSVFVSLCLCVFVSLCLCVCLSVCLFVCLLSVCPSHSTPLSGDTGGGGGGGAEEAEPEDMDPYDLADPVDILSQLNKQCSDFQNMLVLIYYFLTYFTTTSPRERVLSIAL